MRANRIRSVASAEATFARYEQEGAEVSGDETEFFEGPGGETAQNRLGMEGYRDGIQQARDGMQETLPAGEIIHPDGVDG
jgi:hypothetical protein